MQLQQILTVTVIMLTLDAIWLTLRMPYHRQVFALLQSQPLQLRYIPAAITYILMIVGVWYFAVAPAESWMDAAGRGALIGLLMYGVYDMTNMATLVKYPVMYAVTDMAWGAALCGVTAALARL